MTYNCCIHGEKECEATEISMKDVVFFRADGKKAENVVLKGGIDETTEESIFYELIGFSGEVGKMLIDGKETYKRLFIQRVYPYLQKTDDTPVSASEKLVREDIKKLTDNAEEIKKLKEQVEKKKDGGEVRYIERALRTLPPRSGKYLDKLKERLEVWRAKL